MRSDPSGAALVLVRPIYRLLKAAVAFHAEGVRKIAERFGVNPGTVQLVQAGSKPHGFDFPLGGYRRPPQGIPQSHYKHSLLPVSCIALLPISCIALADF
jgi:hypothetical protein